jgi:hypothetical protein
MYEVMPQRCKQILDSGSSYGSYGIGIDIKIGWFILMTQGQGPVLAWSQREIK